MSRCGWDRRVTVGVTVLLGLVALLGLGVVALPAGAADGPVIRAAPGRYVALGDSYASGEGVEPFVAGTDGPPGNRCHRSSEAYSQLLPAAVPLPPVREFWACSGARIADFSPGHGQGGEPGQLEHLTGATDVVTLSVGGNDMQFARVLGSCFATRACQRPLAPIARWLRAGTQARLVALYRDVLVRAPAAQVYVVGYPRFVAAVPSPLCRLVGLEPAEARWLVAEAERFDAASRAAVAAVGDPRLHYVGTLDAFAGGEACSATSRLVTGFVPRHLEYSFHPTREGQAVLAARVAAALAG